MPEIVGRLRTPRLAAAPATPQAGEMYYNTATNKLFWWDGTKWVDSTGGTSTTILAAAYRSQPGPSATVGAVWAALDPRIAGVRIEPVGAFTENADKSVSVTEAGWYDLSATVASIAAFDNGIHVALGTTAGASDLGMSGGRGSAGTGAQATISISTYLAAGTKVFVSGYAATSTSLHIRSFSIARIGGPQGQVEVYEQPTTPASTNQGAIWIDTDDAPPTGNVPPGGTVGQIITKTGSADYAAGWANPAVTGITGQTYTMTGYSNDRVINAGATTIAEIANVLATLIDDMKQAGLIKP